MPKTLPPPLSDAAIIELADERKHEQSQRLSEYERAKRAYHGESPDWQSFVEGSISDGRPVVRQLATIADDSLGRRGAPNFVYAAGRDLSAIYGSVPKVDVNPETKQDKDVISVATKRTRALREQWDHSSMTTQNQQFGWFMFCFGDAVYTIDVLTPDEAEDLDDPSQPAGIYFNCISPEMAYPSFIGGRSSRKLDDLLIIDHMSRREARRRWPVLTPGEEDDKHIDVITYYGRVQRTVLVDGVRVQHFDHNLGFCPARWFSKEITDGRLAQSDVAKAVDLHYSLQALWYLMQDTAQWAAFPMVVTIGGRAAFGKGQVEVGPGAHVSVGIGGDVKILAPQGNPQAVEMLLNQAIDQLMKIIGISPVRVNNQIDRSNVSARSVRAQQAPMQSRVNQAYLMIGKGFEDMNAMAMRMLASKETKLADADMPLYGKDDNGVFSESFTGSDFDGWVRNEVAFDSFIGSDRTERLHNALLLWKANPKGFPWRKVIEEWGAEDAPDIMAQAKADAAEEGPPPGGPGGESQASPGPPGGGPPGGPGGAPGPGPASPPPGPPGPPPITPFPASPIPPNAKGIGSPPPVPDVTKILTEALAGLQLVGTILPPGPHLEEGKVVVSISDWKDKKQVSDALTEAAKQIDPSYTVVVKIAKGSKG